MGRVLFEAYFAYGVISNKNYGDALMCWSGEASAVLAVVGLGTTVYAAYKKEPAPLYIALGYFSLMELLQAYTYTVIDQCSLPANQIATLLGYLHISFQPFFINALSMHFIPKEKAAKIAPYAYGVCFISVIFMMFQLYPFEWAGHCSELRPLCGNQICSISGDWHIAWELPTNGIGNSWLLFAYGFPSYCFAAFFMPVIYGSWRMTLYHWAVGPALALSLTSNPDEWAAVWCLLSIGILLLVVKTPLRKLLYVRSWFLWDLRAKLSSLYRLVFKRG